MTEKPNFFKLGIFMLFGIALVIAGLVLFGSGIIAKDRIYFETYFAESVIGMSPGSAVVLNGLKIGVVEEMNFVRRSYDLPDDEIGISKYDQYIQVICSMQETALPTPVDEDSRERLEKYVDNGFRMRLASNFITGQAYLKAEFLDPNRFPAMKVPWEPVNTYIPSAPSTLLTMRDSVDRILTKLEELDYKSVVENTRHLLETVNKAVIEADVKKISDNTNDFITELRETNKRMADLVSQPVSEEEMANIPMLINEFKSTLIQLQDAISTKNPELTEILENIKRVTENLNYITERLRDNPSDLLFSEPPTKKED